ncbi:hypothetical protein Dip510_000909 [Elusimicrobium posterum]|uniref:hypothetical protein n=1 Tax=Elusimicrobium posterum TaxID=3116653 RepID=UPI003C756E2F
MGKEIKNIENQVVIKSILTAHRWSKTLLSGEYKSVAEIAQKEKLMPSYVSRILNLAFLPPKLILNILENKETEALTLDKLLKMATSSSTSKLPNIE